MTTEAFVLTKYGNAEDAFQLKTVDLPALKSNEVLIDSEGFGLNYADVMARRNMYKEANPNAYLANFVEFILRNERNVYFNKVLRKGMKEFFENRILSYPESKNLPVHFVGSIAYFAQDAIKDVARLNMIGLGNIVRRPIDGLIEYHKEKLKLEQI